MIKIYALYNPITNLPFYVGATKTKLSIRLSDHITTANGIYGINCNKKGLQKKTLINSIINQGLMPEIKILKEVNSDEVDYFEKYFYDLFISQGIDLLQSKNKFAYQREQKHRTIEK